LSSVKHELPPQSPIEDFRRHEPAKEADHHTFPANGITMLWRFDLESNQYGSCDLAGFYAIIELHLDRPVDSPATSS
jgi:hypothetical protein